MSAMSLFQWLVKHNFGGFTIEDGRMRRAEDLAKGKARLQLVTGSGNGNLHLGVQQQIHSYQVEWKILHNPPTNTARVTPSCTCADWLQSGGWTEKRLCKHLVAVALVSDIPSIIEAAKPEAYIPNADPAAVAPQPTPDPIKGNPPFQEEVAQAIDRAILGLADQVLEVLNEDLVPLLVGPTGCGKTSAIRRVASLMDRRLVEHAGSDSYTDSDLVGVEMPNGKKMPGPIAQALGNAREMGEPVLLFLDEFTRYHLRAQESLMRLLLPIPSEVVKSLGIPFDGAVRATSAPFWGDEWAPASDVHIALACNPWGTPLDPALVRRTVPINVGFSDGVAGLFSLKLATAIRVSWTGTQDGTLPLPLEYGELVRATGPDDERILDRYRSRLQILDPAAATAFDALLKGTGV